MDFIVTRVLIEHDQNKLRSNSAANIRGCIRRIRSICKKQLDYEPSYDVVWKRAMICVANGALLNALLVQPLLDVVGEYFDSMSEQDKSIRIVKFARSLTPDQFRNVGDLLIPYMPKTSGWYRLDIICKRTCNNITVLCDVLEDFDLVDDLICIFDCSGEEHGDHDFINYATLEMYSFIRNLDNECLRLFWMYLGSLKDNRWQVEWFYGNMTDNQVLDIQDYFESAYYSCYIINGFFTAQKHLHYYLNTGTETVLSGTNAVNEQETVMSR